MPAACSRDATPRRRPHPSRDRLTIEALVAVDSPSYPRVSPDGRRLVYVAEHAGARQLFLHPLRGGLTRPLTASEKDVSDPDWSPDGSRIAFVQDRQIWTIEVDGGRVARVADHPSGEAAPRWAPDGRRLAFISRRRGWSQVWLVDLPRPGRGRPPTEDHPPDPRRLTHGSHDIEAFSWSPDGRRLALVSQRATDLLTRQVHVLDVDAALADTADAERLVAGGDGWAGAPTWSPDGADLVYVDDRDGWFHVWRVPVEGGVAVRLTSGDAEHGEPSGERPYTPRLSPDGRRLAHVRVADGRIDVVVADLERDGRSVRAERVVNPFPGVWRCLGWATGESLLAIGESSDRPQDVWLLPATTTGRPQAITDSLPVALPVRRFVRPERVRFAARDGLAIEGLLYRPSEATGRRGAPRVPVVVFAHGGPTSQALVEWRPFLQLLVQEGIAVLALDFRGSSGYGREFRWANRGEWGHADAFDCIDAGRWAAAQAWADGRLAMYGGSYGGYLTLCALVEEPELWRCGVDLFGDSEIAESYRHGDRVGRIDLERMMGRPDDPVAAERYRRGSPVYRAERIAAPLLILHGRKDKRVVPLMSERMVEALEIEGKYHEVHWYDDEEHGWERRENRRDAFERILRFLKRHLLDDAEADAARGG